MAGGADSRDQMMSFAGDLTIKVPCLHAAKVKVKSCASIAVRVAQNLNMALKKKNKTGDRKQFNLQLDFVENLEMPLLFCKKAVVESQLAKLL